MKSIKVIEGQRKVAGLMRCITCQREYELRVPIWRCACGGLLDIDLVDDFIMEQINPNKTGLWRYSDAIKSVVKKEVSLGEGFTPLIPLGIENRQILVKQDHLFPSGSYKDRGASVMVSQIKALGIRKVVEDSSGNAGCAVAAYCANAGIECEIFVPDNTSPAKLAQIEQYGATLRKIPGTREDTAAAVMVAAESVYYASHSWNPFFFQGTKTFAYEVCEQLGWNAPDDVILPVGNGTLLLGAWIGFQELSRCGMINQIPRIIAVQAENCAPLADAFDLGQASAATIRPRETLAEGIAIAQPVRGGQILQAVRASRGQFIKVSEKEIADELIVLCRQGFYIEPTGAATIAGARKALARLPKSDVVVTVFTGHGLKASEKMQKLSHPTRG
jgi:threonine synthase